MPDNLSGKISYPKAANKLQSAYKMLLVLEKIAELNKEVSLTEISQIMGMPKATARRLILLLVECNYLSQNAENGKYYLTMKLFTLGRKAVEKQDVLKTAMPYMTKLGNRFNETVNLVVRDQDCGVYIGVRESKQRIRLYSRIGERIPLYCSGVGKVLLSDLSQESIAEILRGVTWRSYTEKTVTNLDDLMMQIRHVKTVGYAIDNEELTKGVMCIAFPVRDSSSNIIAALSISGLVQNIESNETEIIEVLRKASFEISRDLGFLC